MKLKRKSLQQKDKKIKIMSTKLEKIRYQNLG